MRRTYIMKYGIQMYSVRDVAKNDLYAALKSVADIGYKFVEFAGFFGNSAEDVRAWLDELGLEVCSTHTDPEELTPGRIAETVKYHKTIGNKNIIIPGIWYNTEKELNYSVELINFANDYLAKEGIALGYHNHYKEFYTMDYGAVVHKEFETRTDVEFEIDTFWAFYAGEDPIAILERLKDRIKVIHLKDGLETRKGKALGEGYAPVERVLDKAIELGFTVVVESEGLDPTGPEEVERCYKYLMSLGK